MRKRKCRRERERVCVREGSEKDIGVRRLKKQIWHKWMEAGRERMEDVMR